MVRTAWYVSVSIITTLAGCATYTVDEVRQMGTDRQHSFTISGDYRDAYRHLKETSEHCFRSRLGMSQASIEGGLYPDKSMGEVIVRTNGTPSGWVFMLVELASAGDKTNGVVTFPSGSAGHTWAERAKDWAQGVPTGC